MTVVITPVGLLTGPDLRGAAESYPDHVNRLGHLPSARPQLFDTLERSNLRGRGGAAFPVGVKWRTVSRSRGRPVILVNGAEGEPLSRKDRLLMEKRPHLVLDGALLAAGALDAKTIVVYVGTKHHHAITALHRALLERPAADRKYVRLVSAPGGYVSGEETAAVHFINDGIALPMAVPPRPFERGVGARPTLVQNVESLAHVALIARYGDDWFRSLGRGRASGTNLITVTDLATGPGTGPMTASVTNPATGLPTRTTVLEAAQGTTVGEVMIAARRPSPYLGAILLGGYFGGWVPAAEAAAVELDSVALKTHGRSLGCGVVGSLPEGRCGVVETGRILGYLARESARQCGPCVFGLRAIAAAAGRISTVTAGDADLRNLERWSRQLAGRGACRHPDGAAGMLGSALRVFGAEFELHIRHRRCSATVPTGS